MKNDPKGQDLSELVQHIRRILPDHRHLTRMHENKEADIVEFTWHSRHFLVRPTLDAFELKGKTIMVTGASQLMQAALRTKDRNTKIVGAVLETIHAAEENMRVHPDKAFALLKKVKTTLLRLAGKPDAARQAAA